ncbi:MAG: hypothetical protein L3K52_16635 [Candidatus Thiothrix sulfatifontis]|nr:MAG: hypothetical protein L3K52_16635 [Candidatus Thiothrix sulfatifontis]
MSDINTLLREIHSRADSLAIFAQHAAALDSTVSTRKSDTVQTVLYSLSVLQTLHTDLLTLLKQEKAEKTESYTDLNGEIVQVDMLDWLEDGYYTDDEGDRMPCSRYCIGDDDGDGISVWLNEDMVEVEA